MKHENIFKLAALAAATGLAGCADEKPLLDDVSALHQQVSKLQADTAALQSQSSGSADAGQMASLRQEVAQLQSDVQIAGILASQANNAAQSAETAATASDDKVNKLFRRSPAQQ
jgi:outer membrane murein-binding lipoprotein Lpp